MRFDLETFQSTALTKKGIRSQSKQAKKKKKTSSIFSHYYNSFPDIAFFSLRYCFFTLTYVYPAQNTTHCDLTVMRKSF